MLSVKGVYEEFQAFFEMGADFEAEVGFGFVDSCQGVLDISLAFEVVEGFDGGAEDGVDGFDELVEGVALAAGDVEDLAADAGGGAG